MEALLIYRMMLSVVTFISVFFFFQGSISAHTNVVGTSPKDGQVLTASPEQIVLEFSGQVTGNAVNIELLDKNAKQIQIPKVKMSDSLTKVHAEIQKLKNGIYTVRWSLISSDGHPAEGLYTFSVGEKIENNAAVSNVKNSSLFSEITMVIIRYIVEGMILIGAGLTWMSLFARRYQLPDLLQRIGKWKSIFVGIIVAGLIAELFVYATMLPKGSSLLQSPFSVMSIIQLILFVLLFLQHMGDEWYALIWAFLVMSFSFTGHVWITDPNWAAIIMRMIHVMSISIWLGALSYLVVVLVWKVFHNITFDQKGFRTFFSIVAGVSFGFALLSGELIVFLQTRNWILISSDSLWTTILNIKVFAVLFITILAWRQTSRWKRDVGVINRRLLLLEIIVAIIVLLAGIWMSQISFPVPFAKG